MRSIKKISQSGKGLTFEMQINIQLLKKKIPLHIALKINNILRIYMFICTYMRIYENKTVEIFLFRAWKDGTVAKVLDMQGPEPGSQDTCKKLSTMVHTCDSSTGAAEPGASLKLSNSGSVKGPVSKEKRKESEEKVKTEEDD